ncbi:MAG: hypothetical protein ACREBS_10380 [Nitrososphaerales archaeon]
MLDSIRRLFLMTWLWVIFAGFYLVAYAFWVPSLFSNLAVMIAVLVVTLVLGASQLLDGFRRAIQLQYAEVSRSLPFKRVWQFLAGIVLLGYVLVYVPPSGRIVAHWPLDLGITIVSGIVIIVYSIWNK